MSAAESATVTIVHLEATELLCDIEFIADHWDDLLESRYSGTPRPWRQALLDPEQRERQRERDRTEREYRDPDAPGFTSAPEHIDVLDVIVDTWVVLDELAHLISPDWRNTPAGGAVDRRKAETAGPMRVTEIAPMTQLITTWLPSSIDDLPPLRVERAARHVASAVREMSRVLALVRAGQLLAGAVCPFCLGVTPRHPEGGAITMRVEEIPGSRQRGLDAAAAVVCWNPLCRPGEDECGTWMRGRPAWSWHEWDWLAKRLILADPPAHPPIPEPARPEGFSEEPIVPIDHGWRPATDRRLSTDDGEPEALAGVTDEPEYEQPGEPIRFIGGPFHSQRRRFVRIDRTLAVVQPAGENVRLTSVLEATAYTHDGGRTLGVYVLAISGEPRYEWEGALIQPNASDGTSYGR